MAAAFPFGIEEEYFLVDAQTKLVAHEVPRAFFEAAGTATQGRISTEFLQPQIEVKSSPHVNMADARCELQSLLSMAWPFSRQARIPRPCGARPGRHRRNATTW
jgi:gamma-glutamyl:cysteine ligase YbdK (ATP-grasp superfamily)